VGTTTTTSRRCSFAKQLQRKASQKRRCSYVANRGTRGLWRDTCAASNSDVKGRALNRLVEVKVLVNKGLQEGSIQAGSLPGGS